MKCIKYIRTNRIERVSNEEAVARVETGEWRYSTKSKMRQRPRGNILDTLPKGLWFGYVRNVTAKIMRNKYCRI